MLEMRAAIARGKNGMRFRLPEPDVAGGHGEIRSLLAAARETSPFGLEQSPIVRRRRLRTLNAFWRRNGRP